MMGPLKPILPKLLIAIFIAFVPLSLSKAESKCSALMRGSSGKAIVFTEDQHLQILSDLTVRLQNEGVGDLTLVKSAAQSIEKALSESQPNRDIYFLGQQLVKKIGERPDSHDILLPVLKEAKKKLYNPSEPYGNALCDLFNVFSANPAFKKETNELAALVLKVSRAKTKLSGVDLFLAVTYGRLDDEALKREIVEYMLTLMQPDKNNFPLTVLSSLNPNLKLYARVPVALGVDTDLWELAKIKNATTYSDWDNFGWTVDGKAIILFDETFKKVMTDATQVHFEIGAQLKDLEAWTVPLKLES